MIINNIKKILVVNFMLILCIQLNAGELHFEHISTPQGLSQSYVFSIYQDSKGYMWFGTWDGLNRFDGLGFKTFKPDPNNPNSLSNNCVTTIIEDNRGTLWIGTNGGGLCKLIPSYYFIESNLRSIEAVDYEYIGDNSIVKQFRTSNQPGFISSNNITSLCFDDMGYLWIGTYGGGINKVHPDSSENSFQSVLANNKKGSLPDNNITCLMKDRSGNIWVGTNKGLARFNPSHNVEKLIFEVYTKQDDNPFSLQHEKITCITEDMARNIWIGTKGGGIFIIPEAELGRGRNARFIHYKVNPQDPNSLSNNIVKSIYPDSKGILWIGTLTGLNKVNKTKGLTALTFERYLYNPAIETSLSDNHIESIYEDKSGMLWVGTFEGLNKTDLNKKKFNSLRVNVNDPYSLVDHRVNSIFAESDGTLWLGSESGILMKKEEKELPSFYYFSNGKITLLTKPVIDMLKNRYTNTVEIENTTPFDPYSSGNFINSIVSDSKKNLWIGGVGLYKSENTLLSYLYYPPNSYDQGSISGWAVWDTYTDRKNNLWICTSGGLNKYDYASNRFLHIKHNSEDTNSLSSDMVYTIEEDVYGNLWIGTDMGINLWKKDELDKNNTRFLHFQYNQNGKNNLSSNKIWVIHQDKKGTIWIGTEGGGLNKVHHITKTLDSISFKVYKEKNGLPSNIICGILEDHSGNLWISTTRGLSRFDPQNETFRNYTENDGIPGMEFKKGAYSESQTTMFFGSTNGIVYFIPDSITDNPVIPKVIITDFKIYNRSIPIGETEEGRTILEKPISETEQIILSYNDDVISFDFIALHYLIPSKNNYAYMMEGFEDKWNYTDATTRFATYTNLSPGKYIFRVKASNSDNIWNETGTSIVVIIKPPFYTTIWAYLLYAVALFLSFIGIRNYTLSKERLRQQLQLAELEATRRDEMAQKNQEVNQMKLRFFTNISHEFKTPLTLILGPAENLMKTMEKASPSIKQQIQLVQRNAAHLLRLVNQLMDFRKLEIGSMQLKASKSDIAAFVNRICHSFLYLARQKNIHFVFPHQPESIELWYDRDMMEKILFNLLSNAFKFTPEEGSIKVSLSKKNTSNPLLKLNQTPSSFPLGYLEIMVQNTGEGIAEDKLFKIFERFYQVENTRSNKYEGSGIGLALTKELVEMHKGEIDAKSNPNIETTFTVRLPLGNTHLNPDQLIEIVEPESDTIEFGPSIKYYLSTSDKIEKDIEREMIEQEHGDETPIVLIIEDNEDLRLYIHASLSNTYRIEEAPNGMIGFEKAQQLIPDIIITDIMMPDMDGFELTKRLKSNDVTSHIPLIMLTALTAEDARIQGIQLGADDYITKPFNTLLLEARIKNLIESRQLLKLKFSKGLIEEEELSTTLSDKEFLHKAIQLIEAHMSNPDFSVEDFSDELGLSRAQLYRKIKGLSGQTVSEFVRYLRLKKAARLIKEGSLTMNEIMYKVGFNSPSYFSKCFKNLFGQSPTEYGQIKNELWDRTE